ncbi:MAG: hypothetical protein JXR03_15285 [Cyclobacteriaceae bacterium]
MNFIEYLKTKKIDPIKLKTGSPETFEEFESLFMQMHPSSFTAQKLFLINKLRRQYLLEKDKIEDTQKKPAAAKPKIMARPKPKPKL